MPGIYLSEEEMEALMGAPSLAQRLYVLGIRPSMSFKTGMVGVETKISWHGLARELRVEAARGIKEELPSKEQIRRAAQHLVKRGLIIEQSEGIRLVFRCLLARLPSSAQKKPDSNPTGLAARKPTGTDAIQDADMDGLFERPSEKDDRIADIPEIEKPTHFRGSEISTTTAATRASDGSFPMHLGWRSSEGIGERLKLFGISLDSIPIDQRKFIFAEFVNFWLDKPTRQHRQSEWDKKLIDQIVRHVRGGHHDTASIPTRKPGAERAHGRAEVAAALGDLDHDFLS